MASIQLLAVTVCAFFSATSARKTWNNVKFAVSLFQDWDYRTQQEPPYQEMVTIFEYSGQNGERTMRFHAFNKLWILKLKINSVLFGKDFAFEYINKGGYVRKTDSVDRNCYFIGQASAGPNEIGYAAVTTCSGKLQGYIITNKNDYAINPYTSIKNVYGPETSKRSIKQLDEEMARMRRFSIDANNFLNGEWIDIHFHPMPLPFGRTINLELGMVIEKSYIAAFREEISEDEADLRQHLAQLANNVQTWYIHPTLGYRVWITVQKIVITEDEWLPKDARSLGGVCNWHSNAIRGARSWDATVFLSDDLTYWNGGEGLGMVNGACDPWGQHCVGVGKKAFQASTLTRVITHELGHILGMTDAYYPPMQQLCFTGIMRQGVYEDNDWATCAVQRMESLVHSRPKKCLQETPSLRSNQIPPLIPVNVAWRARAEQSSTYHNDRDWGAWKATDGALAGLAFNDPNATLASCTQTTLENTPYLRIEIPDQYSRTVISSIHIYNREDCCETWLQDFEVRVGYQLDQRYNPLCYHHRRSVPGGKYGMVAIQCKRPLSGKYITIQLRGRGILSLCEVQVFQDIVPRPFRLEEQSCVDEITACHNLRKQEHVCDRNSYTGRNCPYTCGFCQKDAPYQPVTLRPGDTSWTTAHPNPSCVDQDIYCYHWKAMGKCRDDYRTQSRCRKSCKLC